ncbi:hypothetical protein ACIGDI_39600 [Streptomyces sp. NPDC085900]|uniref:hypothetical protein n=1 Tax=Streptomyces sp. NPDC085900 TaxID=3365737 RepID=UPI0037D5496D
MIPARRRNSATSRNPYRRNDRRSGPRLPQRALRWTALPVTSLHLLWVASGAALLLMGFMFGGFGARMTWIVWGAATVVMVWSGTPGDARQVAAALVTVAWGLASIPAMRGLSLRSIRM